jgi:hypothetical protein
VQLLRENEKTTPSRAQRRTLLAVGVLGLDGEDGLLALLHGGDGSVPALNHLACETVTTRETRNACVGGRDGTFAEGELEGVACAGVEHLARLQLALVGH